MGVGLRGGGLRGGSFDGKVGLPVHAAEESGEASEEDAEVEGLGEVVVGAGGEAFDDVFGAAAGGKKEDRSVAVGFAKGTDDGEAVAAGEHDVEEDGDGRIGGAGSGGFKEPGEGCVAVGFVVRAVAFGFEIEDEALGEVFLVFNDGDERGLGHEGGESGCPRESYACGFYLRRRGGRRTRTPFHAIWIPMQKRMNATTRRTP